MCKYDQHKTEEVEVDEISDKSHKEQADLILDFVLKVNNQYEPLKKENIDFPHFDNSSIPYLKEKEVEAYMKEINTKPSTPPGDIPAHIVKRFAKYISRPLTYILNTCLKRGEWPTIWKIEAITPIPKVIPPTKMDKLLPISGLKVLNKVSEKIFSDMIIEDMKTKLDPAQFANQKNLGIQHYLIKMIHNILKALDNNSKGEIFAVIASLVDWKQAFNHQDPTLGIISFKENGVRPALLPMLTNYFQGRKGFVKWKGIQSDEKDIHGGGPQGGFFGNLSFLSQSNDSVKNISEEDKYKFVDDLTVLEIVNLISIGLSSFNVKNSIPSDIPTHNGYIPPENLKTQAYINQISEWTNKKKMKLNTDKSKIMIFNFTNNYQFATRVNMNNVALEVVEETKLLGTYITSDLKWDKNTSNIIKKSNARMQLFRRVASFGASINDMKHIYTLFVRSALEHSSSVWHRSLTQENENSLERIQKSAFRIILGQNYISYKNAQNVLKMDSLKDRRELLFRKFTLKSAKVKQMNNILLKNDKTHNMNTRQQEVFKISHANTERYRKSTGIQMQHTINNIS